MLGGLHIFILMVPIPPSFRMMCGLREKIINVDVRGGLGLLMLFSDEVVPAGLESLFLLGRLLLLLVFICLGMETRANPSLIHLLLIVVSPYFILIYVVFHRIQRN